MLSTIAPPLVQAACSSCVGAVPLHVLRHSCGGCALAGWCYAAVVLHVLWCVCSAGGCAVPLLCCIFRASRVVRVLWLGVFVLCSMFSVSRVVRVRTAADDLDPLSPEFQLIKAKSQIESLEHQLSTQAFPPLVPPSRSAC